MQVFEEKCDKLYAGRYAHKLGEINANRNVGGVAQWLGRRSVAGGRSLIYA